MHSGFCVCSVSWLISSFNQLREWWENLNANCNFMPLLKFSGCLLQTSAASLSGACTFKMPFPYFHYVKTVSGHFLYILLTRSWDSFLYFKNMTFVWYFSICSLWTCQYHYIKINFIHKNGLCSILSSVVPISVWFLIGVFRFPKVCGGVGCLDRLHLSSFFREISGWFSLGQLVFPGCQPLKSSALGSMEREELSNCMPCRSLYWIPSRLSTSLKFSYFCLMCHMEVFEVCSVIVIGKRMFTLSPEIP